MSAVLQSNLNQILTSLRTVTRGPESLHATIERLRPEMEIPSQPSGVAGFRQAPGKNLNWRSGVVASAPSLPRAPITIVLAPLTPVNNRLL